MDEKVIRESCVETFSEVKEAISLGADRIELNDNMADWGTTPSFGNMKKSFAYCKDMNIPILVMNRPRGGNFVYSEDEKEIIRIDLDAIIELGADGVAFGALYENNELDKEFLEEILSKCKEGGLEVTFHRAFDSIPGDLQLESLKWLADRGVKRVATHGGADSSDILENALRLRELNELDARIEIMAGGGVTKENYEELVEKTGLREVHGTRVV